MANKFHPIRTIHPIREHTGTIFFFHEAGETGLGICEYITNIINSVFALPHLKIVFPTAPQNTVNGEEIARVWFDCNDNSIYSPENTQSINNTCIDIVKMIEKEMRNNNFTQSQIIVGGFAMGGALSMHLAFRYLPDLAAAFALSSFLNNNTKVYESVNLMHSKCPIYMAHGLKDRVVRYEWGLTTYKNLKGLGVDAEFNSFDGGHEFVEDILYDLYHWIMYMFPEDT